MIVFSERRRSSSTGSRSSSQMSAVGWSPPNRGSDSRSATSTHRAAALRIVGLVLEKVTVRRVTSLRRTDGAAAAAAAADVTLSSLLFS